MGTSWRRNRSDASWPSARLSTRKTPPAPETPPGGRTSSTRDMAAFSTETSVTRTVRTPWSAPSVHPVSS